MNSLFENFKHSFEHYLDCYLCHLPAIQPISNAEKYSVLNGGKRLRPILVYLGAFATAPRDKGVNAEDLIVELAVGIELIHSYSLVHDDLPCMDNDELRRGKPTTHVKFGAGMATLAGDALLNSAMEIMLSALNNVFYMNCKVVKDNYQSEIHSIQYIIQNSGINGMVGGQCLDLNDDKTKYTVEDYNKLNLLKTGALIRAALVSGALRFDAEDKIIDAFENYANHLGLMFQIVDDILDVTSNVEILGKEVNHDKETGKLTYIDLVGMDQARIDCINHANLAKEAIKAVADDIFGAEYFYDLIDEMLNRVY